MSSIAKSQGRVQILVVEDSDTNLKVLTRILEKANYQVLQAQDGKQALDLVEDSVPDLILLDVNLPEMDGLEVCQQIKAQDRYRDTPVIFISSLSAVEDKIKGFNAGGVDYITKPFHIEEVLARVQNHLILRNLQQQLEQANADLRTQIEEIIASRHALQKSEESFRLLAENVDEIFWMYSPDEDELYYVNPAFEIITGKSIANLYAHPASWINLLHPDDRKRARADMSLPGRAALKDLYSGEYRFLKPDGSEGWLWLREKPIYDLNGLLRMRIRVATDITASKQAEQEALKARKLAEERAAETQIALDREQQLNQITRIISSSLDIQELLQNVVSLTVDLLAVDAGTMGILSAGKQFVTFSYFYNIPDAMKERTRIPKGKGVLWEVLQKGKAVLVNDLDTELLTIPEMFGSGVHNLLAVPVAAGDEILGVLLFGSFSPNAVFTERDVSLAEAVGRQAGVALRNARLYEEMQKMAITDTLTQLFSRRHFFDEAKKELLRVQRYGGMLSAIMLDIDHFKRVNDTYGHTIGDQVLREVASRCYQSLRRTDFIGRYGGEEFAMILSETGQEEARRTAERICQEIARESVIVDGLDLPITVSLGVSTYEMQTAARPPKRELALERLLDQADQAMYQAKRAGRNQVVVWHSTEETS